jgi:hypothetical protein
VIGMGKLEAVQSIRDLIQVEVRIMKKIGAGKDGSKKDYREEEIAVRKLYAALTGESATTAEVSEMLGE